jgi:type VI secretion system protein ImpA
LREDYSPLAIYHQIKDARTAARAAERKLAKGEDDGEPQDERPSWKPVLQLAPRIIAGESKDLEVAAWWLEGLVREHGFAGLRDGFRLVRELCERFWDQLYPLPDEDGVATRVAPLTGLNGDDSDGVLVAPILGVPITAAGTYRAFSVLDYRQATDMERVQDPEKRVQRLDQGAVSLEMFDKGVLETPTERVQEMLADATAAGEEFAKLCAVLDEKCGLDQNGQPQAPPSSSLRKALEDVREQLQRIAKQRGPAAADTAGDAAAAADGAPTAASDGGRVGPLRSRDDALRMLLLTAEFFKRSEPHSPLAYVLEQAVRWGRMPLPELLTELIPEEALRAQLFRLVGIRSQEKRE